MMFKKVFFLLATLFISTQASAQVAAPTLLEEFITPNWKATWNVVLVSQDLLSKAKEDLKKAAQHGLEIYNRLDANQSNSELNQLLNQNSAGTFTVSQDLAKILSITQQVAKQSKEPLAKQIKIDLAANQVTLKSADVEINIEPLLKGYLADVIMQDLMGMGWQNSLFELEGVFIAKGKNTSGSWRIPVSDPTTANAHHAFLYKASELSAATVSLSQVGTNLPSSDLKSVTIFSPEGACKAQGLAAYTFTLGLNNGTKFLKSAKIDKAVFVDQSGNFVHYPADPAHTK